MKAKDIKLQLENSIRRLKLEIGTLYYAYRHKETPLLAKILSAVVVGYALSPIDLIPDFIPLLGYLDDIIILPLGIALVMKLIPKKIIGISRAKAKVHFIEDKKNNWVVASIIFCIWISVLVIVGAQLGQ